MLEVHAPWMYSPFSEPSSVDFDLELEHTFAALPSELKALVLLSADVHTLGACVRVSREMGKVVHQVLQGRAAQRELPTEGGLQMMLWRERRELGLRAARAIAPR